MCNFMKKSVKKLLTGMIISSMLSSSFNVLAANNVEIKGISVLENDKVVATFEPTDGNIQLTPEQMLQVTVSVKGDEIGFALARQLGREVVSLAARLR